MPWVNMDGFLQRHPATEAPSTTRFLWNGQCSSVKRLAIPVHVTWFHALRTPQLHHLAQDVEQIYAKETLLIGIKDQNIPGKLCICGPPDAVVACPP